MSFSGCGRFLACLTGDPEYKVIYFDLNQTKKEMAFLYLDVSKIMGRDNF